MELDPDLQNLLNDIIASTARGDFFKTCAAAMPPHVAAAIAYVCYVPEAAVERGLTNVPEVCSVRDLRILGHAMAETPNGVKFVRIRTTMTYEELPISSELAAFKVDGQWGLIDERNPNTHQVIEYLAKRFEVSL